MKYLLIILFSFWSLLWSSPEIKTNIQGSVQKNSSHEAIEACEVSIQFAKSGLVFESKTDSNGNYKLTIPQGEFSINYYKTGFTNQKKEFSIHSLKDTFVKINTVYLKPIIETLDSVIARNEYHYDVEHSDKRLISKEVKGKRSTFKAKSASHAPSVLGSSSIRMSESMGASRGSSDDRAVYGTLETRLNLNAGTLTAGEINDFSKWTLWNDLREGKLESFAKYWGILPKHRFTLQVTNNLKLPVANVMVVLKDPSGKILWKSRTDNTGKAECWAGLYDSIDLAKGKYSLEAEYNHRSFKVKRANLFANGMNTIRIPVECVEQNKVDIVFAVDATGSMGDEIRYLQTELYDVIEKVKQKNSRLELNMGSVFYRDKGDAYLTVQQDLSSDIESVMNFIKEQSADGGGDIPEAVDAAMEVAIGQFSWRDDARTRIMFLVLDASPHDSPESKAKLRKYTEMAAQKGIRIVPVVCSGIDKGGEYLMRSMALATNGNYVFLTDDSGIGGGHIKPSTDKIDVETLNVLLVRMIQQYIFMPDCSKPTDTSVMDSLQRTPVDRVSEDSSFINQDPKDSVENSNAESWFLKYYPNPCRGELTVEINGHVTDLYITDINGKIILKVPVRLEMRSTKIDMTAFPAGIYFLRYCLEGKCKSGKFILIH